MKTSTILFMIIAVMHTMTILNTTLLEGEWNGIVLLVSNILFIIGVFYYSAESRAARKQKQ